MEHEIFNSDDEEVIVEQKAEKKTKGFWGNLFTCEFISIFFAGLSLCLNFFARFLGLFTNIAPVVFALLGLGCALAGAVLTIIPMVKKRKMAINLQLILNLFAILISVL